MPYRKPEAELDVRARVLPRLRAGADPTEGVRRRLLRDERSLEAPWVHVALDGEIPMHPEEVRREFGSEVAAFEAASANLDPAAPAHESRGTLHVYRGDHAAEMLLSPAFLRRLQADVGSTKLIVSIPERGLLLAADRAAGHAALASSDVTRTRAEPLTSWVLSVERGRLRGRALRDKTPSSEGRARLPAAQPDAGLRGLPPLRASAHQRPAWMPKSVSGNLALAAACLLGLMALSMTRGAMNRPREVVLPSPELIEAIRGANRAFDDEVDAVRVIAEQTPSGTELVFRSDLGEGAVLAIMARMRREAAQRAGDRSIVALRAELSEPQAAITSPGVIAQLAEALESDVREAHGRPDWDVVVGVAAP